MILAALPEYQSRFRELSHNPFLLDEGIHVNADAHTRNQLCEEAWRVMQPLLDAAYAQKSLEKPIAAKDLLSSVAVVRGA